VLDFGPDQAQTNDSRSNLGRDDRSKMAEGTIKRLTDKGFGFIKTDSGPDLFFHMSNVEGVQFQDLKEGQKVSFTEGRGPKGPRAENVKPI
jgi:CspA family cold shock protein